MSRTRAALNALLALLLAAASGAAAGASGCKMTLVAEWAVRLIGNHLVVDGTVNGHRVGMMLDTGADTLILRSAADRLGLVRRQVRGVRVFGVGGETYVEATNVEEFKVGQFMQKNWRVGVAGERDFGPSLDMILGEDFFEQLDLEFDLAHNAARLFQPAGCDGVPLAYWAQGASEVALLPYHDAGARIMVEVRINGHPVQALLDSGASKSVLDMPVADQVGIRRDSPGVVPAGKGGGLGGHAVDYWIGPVQSFAIGNETITDTVIGFADLWKDATYTPKASHLARKIEFRPGLLLGADFLRAHRVLVSHSQRKLYFTYEGGPVFQPRATAEARREPGAEPGAKAHEDEGKTSPTVQ